MSRQETPRKPRERGFTLVEQVMVMLIIAVLACIGVPALGQMAARNRLQVAQTDVIAALQHARELAVHGQQRIMLCPSRDGQRCSDELHWEYGWLVGHYRSDQADQLDGAPSWTMNDHERLTIVSTVGRRRIRFQPDGSAGGTNATFTLCRTAETRDALVVVLSNAGRVNASKASSDQAVRCANGG